MDKRTIDGEVFFIGAISLRKFCAGDYGWTPVQHFQEWNEGIEALSRTRDRLSKTTNFSCFTTFIMDGERKMEDSADFKVVFEGGYWERWQVRRMLYPEVE